MPNVHSLWRYNSRCVGTIGIVDNAKWAVPLASQFYVCRHNAKYAICEETISLFVCWYIFHWQIWPCVLLNYNFWSAWFFVAFPIVYHFEMPFSSRFRYYKSKNLWWSCNILHFFFSWHCPWKSFSWIVTQIVIIYPRLVQITLGAWPLAHHSGASPSLHHPRRITPGAPPNPIQFRTLMSPLCYVCHWCAICTISCSITQLTLSWNHIQPSTNRITVLYPSEFFLSPIGALYVIMHH